MKWQTERLLANLLIALLVCYDLCAVVIAMIIAIILRFDALRIEYLQNHLVSAPFVLATYLLAFYAFRLYRHRWSFAGVEVVWSIFLANLVATAFSIFWHMRFDGERMPRSIIVMTCLFATALIGGQRLLLRSFLRYRRRTRQAPAKSRWEEEAKRTIIMGDEQSAVEVLSALATERIGRYDIIGILDPDARHHGAFLRGIKILGGWEMMHDLVRQHAVDEVIIALHNGHSAQVRDYMLACCRHKIAVRMVPVTVEWLENPSASRRQMRVDSIRVEDLLHRPQIPLNPQEMQRYLTGKRVLVTGAGGSIGSELCRQVCLHHPASVMLLGHGENSIHAILMELQRTHPHLSQFLQPVICDVRDEQRLARLLDHFRPQIVFHAAAHKHVPLMQSNITEAISNNVGGTRHLIRAATAVGAERLVLISTDKAVNPSSVMGATKFLCEELARAESGKSDTTFVTVRFGNVLGSRGSVLPCFQEQILHGGPVRVTHPEMNRYFMTIPEAVSLVLRSGFSGRSGELFVLDMGKPVRIVSLAEDVIRLSGLVPYRDIAIEFVGLRPGEKLSEELFTEYEQRRASEHERLFVVNRPQYIAPATLDPLIDELLAMAATHDDAQAMTALMRAVPTFRTQEEPISRQAA